MRFFLLFLPGCLCDETVFNVLGQDMLLMVLNLFSWRQDERKWFWKNLDGSKTKELFRIHLVESFIIKALYDVIKSWVEWRKLVGIQHFIWIRWIAKIDTSQDVEPVEHYARKPTEQRICEKWQEFNFWHSALCKKNFYKTTRGEDKKGGNQKASRKGLKDVKEGIRRRQGGNQKASRREPKGIQ